jgi:hypothetical protein
VSQQSVVRIQQQTKQPPNNHQTTTLVHTWHWLLPGTDIFSSSHFSHVMVSSPLLLGAVTL